MLLVPGREIQQALVSIGDKQQSFVGSKQWIGAIELSYVLDTLLGVQARRRVGCGREGAAPCMHGPPCTLARPRWVGGLPQR